MLVKATVKGAMPTTGLAWTVTCGALWSLTVTATLPVPTSPLASVTAQVALKAPPLRKV